MPQTTYVDSNLVAHITSNGEKTESLQPAFLAFTSNQSNITGDGTLYTIVWANEIFDQNADFDGTSTFTAPVTGRYHMEACILVSVGGTVPTGLELILVTSNRSYYFADINQQDLIDSGTGPGTGASWNGSALCDFDAADTATITWQVAGSAKTSDIGSTSYWSGSLIC